MVWADSVTPSLCQGYYNNRYEVFEVNGAHKPKSWPLKVVQNDRSQPGTYEKKCSKRKTIIQLFYTFLGGEGGGRGARKTAGRTSKQD